MADCLSPRMNTIPSRNQLNQENRRAKKTIFVSTSKGPIDILRSEKQKLLTLEGNSRACMYMQLSKTYF